jgi:STE24 endopeptidase
MPRSVEEETRAFLNGLSPAEKARSDGYFEGGYWLGLVNFLNGLEGERKCRPADSGAT